jgi:hypothetical protein
MTRKAKLGIPRGLLARGGLLIAIVLATCGAMTLMIKGCGAEKAEEALSLAQASPASAPATKAIAEVPEEPSSPDLWLSVNGALPAVVIKGWPLRIEVGVFHPGMTENDPDATPIVLTPGKGPWFDALRVSAAGAGAVHSGWSMQPVGESPPTVSLQIGTSALFGIWVTPEETSQLAAGDLDLQAVLDRMTVQTAGEGWKGRVQSRAVSVKVQPEPVPLSEAQQFQKDQIFRTLLHGSTRLGPRTLARRENTAPRS